LILLLHIYLNGHVKNLPERIRLAFIDRASEINYPIEAVVEMALAGYLDSESIGFVDCKPNRGCG
jgi:hypothetical protein